MIIEETKVSPQAVWRAWSKAHALHGQSDLQCGAKGQIKGKSHKKISYQILNVVPERSFSILWKTLFVRLIFIHEVLPSRSGSQVRYDFRIEGFFAWPVRFFLAPKIRNNLKFVLKQFVKQLEGC